MNSFSPLYIFYKDDPAQLIFPVDNLCKWNHKKVSSYFRQLMMSYQKYISITVPIPAHYYMFEMGVTEEASQKDYGMISLNSCYKIGVNLGMDHSEVLKSITYWHSMVLLLFFQKMLLNVIFTNPQYLLDMLSALIKFSFVDSQEDILPANQCLERDDQCTFHEDEIFSSSLLSKPCLPFVLLLFSENFLNCFNISHHCSTFHNKNSKAILYASCITTTSSHRRRYKCIYNVM